MADDKLGKQVSVQGLSVMPNAMEQKYYNMGGKQEQGQKSKGESLGFAKAKLQQQKVLNLYDQQNGKDMARKWSINRL